MVLMTAVSFAILFLLLTGLGYGHSHQLFNWPWREQLDEENIVLRALFINLTQTSIFLIPIMFRGHELISDATRRKLYAGNIYIWLLSWGALILKYFSSPM